MRFVTKWKWFSRAKQHNGGAHGRKIAYTHRHTHAFLAEIPNKNITTLMTTMNGDGFVVVLCGFTGNKISTHAKTTIQMSERDKA